VTATSIAADGGALGDVAGDDPAAEQAVFALARGEAGRPGLARQVSPWQR
jgi:hypothetical protein